MISQFDHIRTSSFAVIAFAMITTGSISGWAQSSIVVPSGPVTLSAVPGQPIVLKINDSHEATVYLSHSEPLELNIKFDIAENLCAENYKAPNCIYSAAIASDRLVFRWSKHTDPSKIDQKVKFQMNFAGNTADNFRNMEEQTISTSLDPYVSKKLDSRFTGEKFVCDQYEWLGDQFVNPSNAKKMLPDLRLKILSTEFMEMNPETGLNENRTNKMTENVLFRPQNESYQLVSLGRIVFAGNYKSSFNFFFSGQTSTLQVLGSGPKQQCQISLSYNIQKAFNGRDLDKNYNEKPNYQVFNEINSIRFSKLKSSLKYILNPPEQTILEFQ